MSEQTTTATDNAETFQHKTPLTGKVYTLPKTVGEGVELKTIIEESIAAARKERRETLQREIDELKGQLTESEKLRERIAELESTLPVKDRETLDYKKQLEKLQKDVESKGQMATKYEAALKSQSLSNALLREAAKYPDIIDIEQATTLFQAQRSPTVALDGEAVKVLAKLNGDDVDLSESFKDFITSERNANLLKNKLQSGSGSTGGSRASTGGKKMSRAQFDALSATARMEFISDGGELT